MKVPIKKNLAPAILRWALAGVFIWFGFSQIINPNHFAAYLPEFIFFSDYVELVLWINGSFDIVFGILLGLGIWTRPVAGLLGLHILAITIKMGYTDIAIRNWGLFFAMVSIFINGEDDYCLRRKK